jgi:hypothetical protein
LSQEYPTSERLTLAVIFAYEYLDCFEPAEKLGATPLTRTAGAS